MFDVYWTDHKKELVGEHRARKEGKREQGDDKTVTSPTESSHNSSHGSSGESSKSSKRSAVQFIVSLFSRNKHQKKKKQSEGVTLTQDMLTQNATSNESLAPMSVDTCDIAMIADDSSVYSTAPDQTVGHPSPTVNTRIGREVSPSAHLELREMPPQEDAATTSSELTIVPRTPRNPVAKKTWPLAENDSPVSLIPGLIVSKTRLNKGMPNNPDEWRAHAETKKQFPKAVSVDDLLDQQIQELVSSRETSLESNTARIFQMEVSDLVDMVKNNPKAIMERLVVMDACGPRPGPIGEELYKEKHKLMLATVHHLEPFIFVSGNDRKKRPGNPSPSLPKKLLTLYETPLTSAFLAAHYSDKQIHHVTRTPLDRVVYPNVNPILVPGNTISVLPFVNGMFDMVYSSLFAVQYRASQYTPVIRSISRIMKPGGVFEAIFVDPLPFPGNTGPLLKAWIKNHLLVNLQRHGLSIKPAEDFQDLAPEAGLTVSRSAETLWFPGILRGDLVEKEGDDPFIDEAYMQRQVDEHLCTMVGREIWRDLYEPHVTLAEGELWWWQIPEIHEECRTWETHWIYHRFKCTQRQI
ncbi:hypothetical protein B0T10DRAFT_572086 [Thelonectria olida]|uniref:Methyltransferase type 11 domain-containing protein n=1 Tax=Thelonectria olida TaxID=1576542 RepID=A0A9P8W4F0_9HYPO|nr:hypothetical protein B0T10DRAFT_572086 [Thelonectria olida]